MPENHRRRGEALSTSDRNRFRSKPRRWGLDVIGVAHLAYSMLKKLHANRYKAHWIEDASFEFYRMRIDEELAELDKATTPNDRMQETADIANFAMMIHERARHLKNLT